MSPLSRVEQLSDRLSPADRVLNASIFVMLASSFVVYVEPAPVDLIFGVVLMLFVGLRLPVTPAIAPLLLLLLLYNIGGFLSYLIVPPQPKALMFMLTSLYMAITGIVFAYYISARPQKNFDIIIKGWIVGAAIASVWALIDYFKLPSPVPLQVLPGRATGLFKDPNVFSTFLILPMVVMLQSLMVGRARSFLVTAATLSLCAIALLLAFSRGAWVNFLLASVLMFAMTFLVTQTGRIRTRMLLMSIGVFIAAAVCFMLLMSIPIVQSMFAERFVLAQSYDSGETGRFGTQLRSLPHLFTLPFGFGPFGYRAALGMDPHNTFINAFSAYGWLGGISYFTLTVTTIFIGAKSALARTPWQYSAICAYAVLLSTLFQGVQIDTDHWRHFYWLLGIIWGLFAAGQHATHRLRSASPQLAGQGA